MNKFATTAVLLGSAAVAQAVSNVAAGRAIVVNKCSYPVYLSAVPAAGEGAEEIDAGAIAPGQSWSQHWTGLTSAEGRHDGWSIKLAKTSAWTDILQYEYTYQPTISETAVWLDLSSVDGTSNPWLSEGWALSCTQECSQPLKQGASYMTSTDDANGMQPVCPASADLTVTLCSSSSDLWTSSSSVQSSSVQGLIPAVVSVATSAVGGILSAVASAVVEPSTTSVSVAAPTTAAPVVSTTSSPVASWTAHTGRPVETDASGRFGIGQHNVVDSDSSSVPTTFATQVSSPVSESPIFKTYGATVTEIEVAWVTSFVTVDYPEATEAAPKKRHVHHAAHHEH